MPAPGQLFSVTREGGQRMLQWLVPGELRWQPIREHRLTEPTLGLQCFVGL